MISDYHLHLTLGDPQGIGPEVVVRALQGWSGPAPVIHGHRGVLARAATLLGLPLPGEDLPAEVREPPAQVDPYAESGLTQRLQLERAVDAACQGEVAALVTAPVTKASLCAAGFSHPGHTGYLAARAGVPVAMMFVSPTLRVVLATEHVPLCRVPALLNGDHLRQVILLAARALVADFGLATPRMAVAGLNPHAGEQGLLGSEERSVLEPAMSAAQRELSAHRIDVQLSGPLPADTVFRRAYQGEFDAVVACYHDQALIPIKLLSPEEAVNVTIGLPYVRTSPAHGSALDIAWTGKADGKSMRAALELAVTLAAKR